jgi:dolichyl-phosphate mannosyltransferase polypeptide 2 regulatory subunit
VKFCGFVGFYLFTGGGCFAILIFFSFFSGIVQPFVDEDHFVHNYFPAREYAIIIPGIAGAALLSFVLVFIGVVMVKASQAKPKSKPKTS